MIEVVCALIIKSGRLLIVQYGPDSKYPGKWEFPGGKVQSGESSDEALIREIREELEMEIQIIIPLEPAIYTYPDKTIRLNPFLCSRVSGDFVLNEHIRYEWVGLGDLSDYDLLPADRAILENEMNGKILTGFFHKTDL
jgi:8-oxo-dGTP diphosphatase